MEVLIKFDKSKHARTWTIQNDQIMDPWMKGMTNDIERATGCYICHGSDISSGELTVLNWPNVGCGRLNPDGSLGSCAICHTTHRFALQWAICTSRNGHNEHQDTYTCQQVIPNHQEKNAPGTGSSPNTLRNTAQCIDSSARILAAASDKSRLSNTGIAPA